MTRFEDRFDSMGTTAAIRLESPTLTTAELARHGAMVRALLDEVERTLTRFDASSELCALNRDARPAVPVTPLMARFAQAARAAAERTGGLVDATLLDEIERAGYRTSRAGVAAAELDAALAAAPARRPARPRADDGMARLSVECAPSGAQRVRRPPGLALDSGGIGKGLAADLAAATLPPGVRFAISCGGDLAVGGPSGEPWQIVVTGARDGREVHRLVLERGGVATSGIHARLWRREDGGYAHHLLDPATGRPAWTGLVAVTAVASSALEAEALAKAALLSGPARARRRLAARGGVLQHDDGRVEIVAGLPVIRLAAA